MRRSSSEDHVPFRFLHEKGVYLVSVEKVDEESIQRSSSDEDNVYLIKLDGIRLIAV